MKLTKMLAVMAIFSVMSTGAEETTAASATAATTTTSTSSIKKLYNKVKESPFSMAYLNDSFSSFNIDGVKTYHYLYAHYGLTSTDKISLVPTFTTDLISRNKVTRERANNTRLHSTQLRYTKSSILNEKDHGVSLYAQVRYYHYSKSNQESGSDGYGRAIISASRSFGKFRLSLTSDNVVYNRNANKASMTHFNMLGVGTSYSLTDSFSVSTATNWYKYNYNNTDSFKEFALLGLYTEYSFGNGLSVGPYFEAEMLTAQDGRDGFTEEWVKNGSVGATLYYSWF
ncbi:hypothetical protein BIY24_08560 [Halobacteriovorax marinus]|uniref:hypothetical protein n=1 Tax=Halobacteriovorax marinus TaxID=97084 RepID=UPI000BC2D05E|nr:hypothetical protein [Halobacteriovorax marinus]ATH08001.1 hypothetical protein BIY24_08560 [Halobacteriovorax marinus]